MGSYEVVRRAGQVWVVEGQALSRDEARVLAERVRGFAQPMADVQRPEPIFDAEPGLTVPQEMFLIACGR